MSKYDWSNVPKEVKWIATDADGVVSGFSEKPYTHRGSLWLCHVDHPDSWVCNIEPFTYHVNNDYPNWQDSLEERPNVD